MSTDVNALAPYDYAWKTPGWSIQNPAYIAGVDGYANPGLPDDVSIVRVFGVFREWDTGRTLEGVLSVRASTILTHVPTKTQYMPGVNRMRFRGNDGISIMLPATDDPQLIAAGGVPWTYVARLTVRGVVQGFEFSLPSIPSEVNITDLIAAAEPVEQ